LAQAIWQTAVLEETLGLRVSAGQIHSSFAPRNTAMPLYEEKLISPFAVRFSQDYVRTTFRDGRSIEASVADVRSKPGVQDYELVLDAPFPPIEILRYKPHGRDGAAGEQWCTFDNRRLYCLQRAAAELWPKRVAIPVQVLYADNGSMRRKYDSLTCGWSVSVQNHLHDATPVCHWDWQQFLDQRSTNYAESQASSLALLTVEADANKAMAELSKAPAEDSALSTLERFLQQEEAAAAVAANKQQLQDQQSSTDGSTGSVASDAATSQQRRRRRARADAPPKAAHEQSAATQDERLTCRQQGNRHGRNRADKLRMTANQAPRWVAVQAA